MKLTNAIPKIGVLEETRQMIKNGKPMTELCSAWDRLTAEPGGSQAVTLILQVLEQQENPANFTRACEMIIDAAAKDLAFATGEPTDEQLALENQIAGAGADENIDDLISQLERLNENVDLMRDKPADVYRRWYQPLRIVARYYEQAEWLLRDLLEAQSIPYSELDNPDWIDPYTGEFDPTYEEDLVRINVPIAGVGDEAFNIDADEFEVFDDTHDTRKMSWDDDEQGKMFPIAGNFIDLEYFEYVGMDDREMNTGPVETKPGFKGKKVPYIPGLTDPGTVCRRLTDAGDVEKFAAQYIKEEANVKERGLPKLKISPAAQAEAKRVSRDVQRHPAYVQAYLECACNARTLTSKKDGKTINLCKAAGWDAWRQSMSPEGNLAYKKALKEGKSHEEAMQTFLTILKTVRITTITKDGLVLSTGRKVNYHIAALKIKNGEIALTDEDRKRLKDILNSHKWGAELVKAL